MSFLRGKSTSFSIWPAGPDMTVKLLMETVNLHTFQPVAEDATESVGFCSWRNLLDGPIDSGFMEGQPDFWLTGLRRDVKRAPAALVTAETARAIADYCQENPGNPPGKDTVKGITAMVREKLNKKAQPRPSHGACMLDVGSSLLYFEGPAAALGWTLPQFKCEAPLYSDTMSNQRFLLWLAWLSTQDEIDAPCSLNGSIGFSTNAKGGKKGKGICADFDGTVTAKDLLERWVVQEKAHVTHLGTLWSVMLPDGWEIGVEATLKAGALKVSGMTFPDEVLESPGTVEERLSLRMQVVTAFSKTVADAYLAWAKTHGAEGVDTPEGYKALLAATA